MSDKVALRGPQGSRELPGLQGELEPKGRQVAQDLGACLEERGWLVRGVQRARAELQGRLDRRGVQDPRGRWGKLGTRGRREMLERLGLRGMWE